MEFPHLEDLYKQYQAKGFQIVSISHEDPETLKAFAKSKGATFPLLSDSTGEATRKYSVDAIPANFLIDKEGRLVNKMIGYNEAEFKRRFVDGVPGLLKETVSQAR